MLKKLPPEGKLEKELRYLVRGLRLLITRVRTLLDRAIKFYTDVPKKTYVRMAHLTEIIIVSGWVLLTIGLLSLYLRR